MGSRRNKVAVEAGRVRARTPRVRAATAAVDAAGTSPPALAFPSAMGSASRPEPAVLQRRSDPPPCRLRPAVPADLAALVGLVAVVIADLRERGIDQWDEAYPDRARIAADVRDGAAQVLEDATGIAGMAVLDTQQDAAYAQAIWAGSHPAVVHRLMLHPRARGTGAARRLMAWAEAEAARRGFDSVRLDAFELNPAALRLYLGLGYLRRGTARFRKGTFALFEKGLAGARS